MTHGFLVHLAQHGQQPHCAALVLFHHLCVFAARKPGLSRLYHHTGTLRDNMWTWPRPPCCGSGRVRAADASAVLPVRLNCESELCHSMLLRPVEVNIFTLRTSVLLYRISSSFFQKCFCKSPFIAFHNKKHLTEQRHHKQEREQQQNERRKERHYMKGTWRKR